MRLGRVRLLLALYWLGETLAGSHGGGKDSREPCGAWGLVEALPVLSASRCGARRWCVACKGGPGGAFLLSISHPGGISTVSVVLRTNYGRMNAFVYGQLSSVALLECVGVEAGYMFVVLLWGVVVLGTEVHPR